jgi:sugar O-acyltransferase (sialic acid O-acetyltransferase NeuD family)
MRSERMVIIGAGGHGLVLADLCDLLGYWQEIVFLDDRFPEIVVCGDWRVVGRMSAIAAAVTDGHSFALGIGSNNLRINFLEILWDQNVELPALIHPSAAVSKRSRIGAGSVVLATAAVNAGAEIGAGAIINTGASVDHECQLEDGVHVCPGARLAGAVKVGRLAMIGVGSCVKQGITVGAGAIVGAGAAVVADIPAGLVVAGVPAKPLCRFGGAS